MMKFTNRYDRNRKPIYEGDVIRGIPASNNAQIILKDDTWILRKSNGAEILLSFLVQNELEIVKTETNGI